MAGQSGASVALMALITQSNRIFLFIDYVCLVYNKPLGSHAQRWPGRRGKGEWSCPAWSVGGGETSAVHGYLNHNFRKCALADLPLMALITLEEPVPSRGVSHCPDTLWQNYFSELNSLLKLSSTLPPIYVISTII